MRIDFLFMIKNGSKMPSSWVLSLLSYLKEDQAKYKENVIALTNIHKEVLFNPLQNSNKSSIVQTSAYQNTSEYVFFICLFVQKYTGRFAGFFKCFRKTSNQIRICRVRYILTLQYVFFRRYFLLSRICRLDSLAFLHFST